MKKMMIWGILTLAASLFAAEECVWQLGREDGASDDFGIPYRAWEYGNAPAVRKSPQMDHETHTFQYRIDENRVIPHPRIVSGLTTESVLDWMPSDEIVSGLKLTWKETEAGNRRLVLALTGWRNLENGNDNQVRVIHKEGIEIELPDGSKRIFYLPPSRKISNESLKFSPVFPVKAGENSLVIRIRSKAKLYQFGFDSIALTKTDSVPDARPILECSFDSGNGIYQYGGKGGLSFLARNLQIGRASCRERV